MEQLIDMVVVSFERTKTHAMPQCVESGSAYGFMQRVSVAMAGVVLSVSVRRVMLDVLLITSRIAIGTGTARIAMVINVHGVCWCVTSV